jgi:hypothetical protein
MSEPTRTQGEHGDGGLLRFPLKNAVAACLPKERLQFGREVSHVGSPGSVRLDADEFLLAPEKLDRHFD